MKKKRQKKGGFSLVELIVALGIFAILASGVTYVVLNSYSTFYGSGDRQALYEYAQEGIEAVRSIQTNSWQDIENVVDQEKGLLKDSNGIWQFSGSSDTRGGLTRVVLISDVQRDSSGDIVEASGTEDPNTKKITVTISAAGIDDYLLETYITNWDAKLWHQTSWSGATMAEFWLNNTHASTSVNMSTSTAGQLSLDFSPDPEIDYGQGTLTLNFGTSTAYSNEKIMQRKFEGGWYLVLTPQNYQADKYDTFEDTDFSNWAYYDNMSRSSTYTEYDNYVAVLTDIGLSDENILTGQFGTTPGERIIIMSFKDPGGVETYWGGHNNNKDPMDAYGMFTFGYNEDSVLDDNGYLYRVNAGSEQQVGVARDSNWHYLVMIDSVSADVDGTYYRRHIYLDGSSRYTYSCDTPPSACTSAQFKTFAALRYDGENDLYIDEIILSKAVNVYENGTSTIQIQPLGVDGFSTVSTTQSTASGRWQGAATYEFQFSTDNGANFGTNSPSYNNNSWLTLSENNLVNYVTPDGDGLDVLKVRIVHTPSASYRASTHIPRTDKVQIGFSPSSNIEEISGWMYSSIYDLGPSDKELESISVQQNVPASCNLSIKLEASNDRTFSSSVSHTFSDDGSVNYTSSTPSNLNGYRYLRYRVGMIACGSSVPTLHDVKIRYK